MPTRECSVPPRGAVPNQRGITDKLAGLAVTPGPGDLLAGAD
jgi:hypothetical protein